MMMLGIETATTVCAAALVRDGTVLAEELLDERNVHAEKLMGMIDAVFRRTGIGLEVMQGIAVSIGPGSFTGLRIGLSVAKGLAYAAEKALVPVSTLEGMAQKAADAAGNGPPGEMILPLLDARRGDVYCALYRKEGEMVRPVWDERIMPLESLVAELGDQLLHVTGDARSALERLLEERHPDARARFRFADDALARCSAATVARIGERLLRQGRSANPELLEPHYLREFLTTTT
jgi:tRNA threonylcarbamoyladenosine biosynthesis protein TsaB